MPVLRGATETPDKPSTPPRQAGGAVHLEAPDKPAINNYDMTILSCQGQAYRTLTDPNQAALRAYADGGGRVFATHYSYTWLDNNKPTPSTANVTDNWNEVATMACRRERSRAQDTGGAPVRGIIDKVR